MARNQAFFAPQLRTMRTGTNEKHTLCIMRLLTPLKMVRKVKPLMIMEPNILVRVLLIVPLCSWLKRPDSSSIAVCSKRCCSWVFCVASGEKVERHEIRRHEDQAFQESKEAASHASLLLLLLCETSSFILHFLYYHLK